MSYEIHKAFSAGFAAAVGLQPRTESNSAHWLAGYDAGYPYRKAKNEALDKYLVSLGQSPQAVIKPCGTEGMYQPMPRPTAYVNDTYTFDCGARIHVSGLLEGKHDFNDGRGHVLFAVYGKGYWPRILIDGRWYSADEVTVLDRV